MKNYTSSVNTVLIETLKAALERKVEYDDNFITMNEIELLVTKYHEDSLPKCNLKLAAFLAHDKKRYHNE